MWYDSNMKTENNILTLQITIDNDAFVGMEHVEIARILHFAADRILFQNPPEILRDINGNTVGFLSYPH